MNISVSQNCSAVATQHAHEDHTPYVMVFLFGGLACGLFLQALTSHRAIVKYVRIPFTVTLLLLGIIFGVLIELLTKTEGQATQLYSTYTMVEAHPKLILYIFIPILIFDSSFRLEAHSVFKAKGQIVLMSTVGLVITTFAIAGSTYLIVAVAQGVKEWSFSVSLVFGSILSATDPVAVVSLLRQLGAPRQITILTEGESLFNDGAAIVAYGIFSIFSRRDLGMESEQGLAAQMLLEMRSMLLSPILGLIAGKVAEFLLKKTFNDGIREKGIILIAVYATFFICELIRCSGVLALVVLGVWLSHRKYSISFETIEDNNRFWDFFSNWANTIIFILAGMVIAKPMVRNVGHHDGSLADYGYLVLIYIFINLARLLSIVILYPLLKRTGYGFNFGWALALTWGGLRGAIALILALEFFETEPVHSCYRESLGDKLVLYVCGCVALTLLINATTYASLLKILRMDAIDIHKIRLMKKVLYHLNLVRVNMLHILKEDRFLAEADWDIVDSLTEIRNPYEDWDKKSDKRKRTDLVFSELDAQKEEARLRLLHVEKVSYWRQFGKGLVSHRSMNCLLDEVEELAEQPGKQVSVAELKENWDIGKFWTKIQKVISFSNDSHQLYQASMIVRRPKWPVFREMYDVMFSQTFDICCTILIVTDVVLFVSELAGAFEQQYDVLDIMLLVLYGIFVLEFILKVFSIGRNYFTSKRNLFDIGFVFLYIGCIVSVYFEARGREPPLYYCLEGLCCLRLFRIYFILPIILPTVLEFVNWKINEQVGLSYDTAKGFIVGEEDASKHMRRLVENQKISDDLKALCHRRRLDAIRYLAELQSKMPGCVTSVKTKQAAQFCMNSLQEALEEMKESGLVNDKEHEDICQAIRDRIWAISQAPPWMRSVSFDRQLPHLNWLNQDPELANAILDQSIQIDYMPGDFVFRQGDKSDGIYIISSGMVRVTVNTDESVPAVEEYIFAGRYFGEMSSLTGEPRTATVISDVKSSIYHIPTAKLLQMLEKHKDLYWQFVITYCITKSSEVLRSHESFEQWSDVKLKEHLTRGDLVDLSASGKYIRRDENEILVLIRGAVKGNGKRYEASKECLVLPKSVTIVARIEASTENPAQRVIWLFAVPPSVPTVRKWFGEEEKAGTPQSRPNTYAARKYSLSVGNDFDGSRPPIDNPDPLLPTSAYGEGVHRMFANYMRRHSKGGKRNSVDN